MIWTRSLGDFASDQKLFPGNDVVHIPCIAINEIDDIEFLRRDEIIHWVFTSRHAAEIFLRRKDLRKLLQGNDICIALGSKTIANLDWDLHVYVPEREAGARELCRYITQHFAPGSVVTVGGNIRAYDVAKHLNEHGFDAQNLDVYKTIVGARNAAGNAFSASEINELKETLEGPIAFASPSAIQGFVDVFSPHENRLANLDTITLGQNAFVLARQYFQNVRKSTSNSLESLVNCTIPK